MVFPVSGEFYHSGSFVFEGSLVNDAVATHNYVCAVDEMRPAPDPDLLGCSRRNQKHKGKHHKNNCP
jgi:hypothetical protein